MVLFISCCASGECVGSQKWCLEDTIGFCVPWHLLRSQTMKHGLEAPNRIKLWTAIMMPVKKKMEMRLYLSYPQFIDFYLFCFWQVVVHSMTHSLHVVIVSLMMMILIGIKWTHWWSLHQIHGCQQVVFILIFFLKKCVLLHNNIVTNNFKKPRNNKIYVRR